MHRCSNTTILKDLSFLYIFHLFVYIFVSCKFYTKKWDLSGKYPCFYAFYSLGFLSGSLVGLHNGKYLGDAFAAAPLL